MTDKNATCSKCGKAVKVTMTFSTPGRPEAPPICLACLEGLTTTPSTTPPGRGGDDG